jgi:hypothetical protein
MKNRQKISSESNPNLNEIRSFGPQYLDVLSGEIEKNLYIIYIKKQVMKQVFPSKGCLTV